MLYLLFLARTGDSDASKHLPEGLKDFSSHYPDLCIELTCVNGVRAATISQGTANWIDKPLLIIYASNLEEGEKLIKHLKDNFSRHLNKLNICLTGIENCP